MHFDSHEKSQEHINKQEEAKHGMLTGMNEHSQIEKSKKKQVGDMSLEMLKVKILII